MRLTFVRVALADVGAWPLTIMAAFVVTIAVVGPGNVSSPLGGILVPWVFISCLTPLALGGVLPGPLFIHERVSPRGHWAPVALRLGGALAVVATATAIVAGLAPPDAQPVSGEGMVAWRNTAVVVGITLASSAWLPGSSSWLAGTALVLVSAAVGVPSGGPYSWSILTRPAEDGRAAIVGLAAFVVGLCVVGLRLHRSPLQRTTADPGRGRRLRWNAARRDECP